MNKHNHYECDYFVVVVVLIKKSSYRARRIQSQGVSLTNIILTYFDILPLCVQSGVSVQRVILLCDTPSRQGEQFYPVILKYVNPLRSYGPDKPIRTHVCTEGRTQARMHKF